MKKNRKKIIIIIFGIFSLIIIVLGIFMPKNTNDEIPSEVTVTSKDATANESKTLDEDIKSNILKKGQLVGIKDKPGTEGYVFMNNDKFAGIYYPSSDYILISIFGSPFDKYKKEAEQALLNTLGINEKTACDINIEIGTPAFANQSESGKIYQPSFCE